MAFVDTVLDFIGRRIAERLEVPAAGYEPFGPSDPETLRRTLQPADVLLVEGHQKLATAIKYLTQSTWSHAALYAADLMGKAAGNGEACLLDRGQSWPRSGRGTAFQVPLLQHAHLPPCGGRPTPKKSR